MSWLPGGGAGRPPVSRLLERYSSCIQLVQAGSFGMRRSTQPAAGLSRNAHMCFSHTAVYPATTCQPLC